MSNLEKRMRNIMQRESLTYKQVSEYAGVSTQAVHKWLSSGNISDEKARAIARNIGLDWVWLKHGISRIPIETLYDIMLGSTAGVMLASWDTFEILALGKRLEEQLDYEASELIGHSTLEFVPGIKEEHIRKGQKLLYGLSGMVNYSYTVNFHDKYSVKALKVSGRGLTTDDEGNTYAIESVEVVEPTGKEDSICSFKLHKKTPLPLEPKEVESIVSKYPEFPWLGDFLDS